MTKLLPLWLCLSLSSSILFSQITINDNSSQSALRKAEQLYGQNQFDSAAVYYQKALQLVEMFDSENPIYIAEVKSDLGTSLWQVGQLEDAKKYLSEAITIFESMETTKPLDLAAAYNNLGNVFKNLGKFYKAENSYLNALKIREEKLGSENAETASSYYNLGLFYTETEEYGKALDYVNSAYEIFAKILPAHHFNFSVCFDVMGNIAHAKGDDYKAMQLYEASIRNHTLGGRPDNYALGYTYSNMGNVFLEWGEYEKAKQHFDRSLQIRQKAFPPTHPEIAQTYANLSNLYILQTDFLSAIESNKKALSIWEKGGNTNLSHMGTMHNRLGTAYLENGDLELSFEHFKKSLTHLQEAHGEQHIDIASTYFHIALYFEKLNNYPQADIYYEKALSNLNFEPNKNENSNYVLSAQRIIEHLNIQTENLLTRYKKSNDLAALKKTYTLCRAANDFFEKYKFQNIAPFSIREYFKNMRQLYERELWSSSQLRSKKEQGFESMANDYKTIARAKANTLLKSFYENEVRQLSNVPDSILAGERVIKIRIGQLEEQRFLELQKKTDRNNDKILKWEEEIFDLKRELEKLKETIKNANPNYYNLMFEKTEINLKGIQEKLRKGQLLLDYFVGDSTLFIFELSKKEQHISYVKMDFNLKQLVTDMREGITGYWLAENKNLDLSKKHIEQYTQAAHLLYEKLFNGTSTNKEEINSLIIVPNGILGYIPFGALLTAPDGHIEQHKERPYLFKKYAISYAPSSNLLFNKNKKKNKVNKECLSIAPSFSGNLNEDSIDNKIVINDIVNPRSSHVPLLFNQSEATAVQKIMGGDLLIGGAATLDNFYKMAADYNILHLATHGKANDKNGDYSYIAFSENGDSTSSYLYAKNLYNLNLNADLVTLSACETGIGELQLGEGIVGQTSAFLYAGVKSLATTLWSIDDAGTTDLMTYFYKNIKSGMRKDVALQKAQLQFLNNSEKPHPYFWSGFILTGDVSPIENGGSFWWWVGGVLLLGVFIFMKYRK